MLDALLLLQWTSTISDSRNAYTKFDNFDVHSSFSIANPKQTATSAEHAPAAAGTRRAVAA
jgi:hypothetical protein